MLTWVFRHRARLARIYGSPATAAPEESREFGDGLEPGQTPETTIAVDLEPLASAHTPQDAGQVQRRSRWVLLRPMGRPSPFSHPGGADRRTG